MSDTVRRVMTFRKREPLAEFAGVLQSLTEHHKKTPIKTYYGGQIRYKSPHVSVTEDGCLALVYVESEDA